MKAEVVSAMFVIAFGAYIAFTVAGHKVNNYNALASSCTEALDSIIIFNGELRKHAEECHERLRKAESKCEAHP